MATFGPAEKKITAKLEKLRKENPEEVDEILKTVIPPSNRNPPNRSQWRKVELAMKFINKSKAEAEKQKANSRTGSPSKSSSSRPATPDNRKSITSIDSREQDRLLTRTNTKHQLLAKHAACTTVVIGHKEKPDKPDKPVQEAADKKTTANTATATTNTDSLSVALEKKISESVKSTAETSTETDPSAKVLLSKKVQTDISLTDEHEIAETSSPKGKKKPLKKQKSLSKITKNFGHML